MKNVIYKTKGRAAEYCLWALNHYGGCTYGCIYCWSPGVTFRKPDDFIAGPQPRVIPLEVMVSAANYKENSPVLLSFISDPYQPAERDLKLTREIIGILHDNDISFTILTKAGELARRDFSLYRQGDSFGTTLTFISEKKSRMWEPGAGLPDERIQNLMLAHDAGIPTWVSLEPVIDPMESIALIHATAKYVDHYKVGKLNYDRLASKIDWRSFALMAIKALQKENKGFYIKRDLAKYLGRLEGIKEGRQLP